MTEITPPTAEELLQKVTLAVTNHPAVRSIGLKDSQVVIGLTNRAVAAQIQDILDAKEIPCIALFTSRVSGTVPKPASELVEQPSASQDSLSQL